MFAPDSVLIPLVAFSVSPFTPVAVTLPTTSELVSTIDTLPLVLAATVPKSLPSVSVMLPPLVELTLVVPADTFNVVPPACVTLPSEVNVRLPARTSPSCVPAAFALRSVNVPVTLPMTVPLMSLPARDRFALLVDVTFSAAALMVPAVCSMAPPAFSTSPPDPLAEIAPTLKPFVSRIDTFAPLATTVPKLLLTLASVMSLPEAAVTLAVPVTFSAAVCATLPSAVNVRLPAVTAPSVVTVAFSLRSPSPCR